MTKQLFKPLRIGLTGGIASGKSAAADAFARLGVPVIDADSAAREVVAAGTSGLQSLIDLLGNEIVLPDGELDRGALRQRIFADPTLRARVEAVLHPRIIARMEEQAAAVTAPYVIMAIPLLAESGYQQHLDRVLVVDAPEESQIQRLMARDGESEATARRMLTAQLPRDRRLAQADEIIDNSGSLDELRAQVERMHRRYLHLARIR